MNSRLNPRVAAGRLGALRVALLIVAAVPAYAQQVPPASAESAVQLPKVSVTGEPTPAADGSAAAGYRVETIQNVGPFGSMRAQDAPYSINVMPLDLINNVQATAPDDLFKMNPATQVYLPNARGGQTDVNIRGFADPAVSEDGLRSTVYRMDIEDKERVEVIEGLNGFLFGPDNPGGMINYVLKRPTASYLNDVTVGYESRGTGFIHADLGGPIDPAGRFGYRINLVAQDGTGITDDARLQRELASVAFDAHITDKLLLQLDGSYSTYRPEGMPATWIFIENVPHPSAPDNSKNWGQPYTTGNDPIAKAGGRLTYTINDALTVRAGAKYADEKQKDYVLTNNLSVSPGTYLPLIFRNANVEQKTTSAFGFLDAHFNSGIVQNVVTVGAYGDIFDIYQPPDRNATVVAPAVDFTAPVFFPEPPLVAGTLPAVKSNHLKHTNFVIGDDLKIGDSWGVLIGVNRARIIDEASDYTAPGNPQTSAYDRDKWTPAGSLIYKPIPTVSVYATYIEGLEEGGIAPDTAVNAFAVLPPLTSKEYEVGAKATLGGVLLTTSLFRIERPNQFLDPTDNVFKQTGNEVHQGFELGISGKVTSDLTLWGGTTLMHSRVADAQANPQLNGKQPIGIGGVADELAKLYAEYALPPLPGFFLTGGIYYTGSFYSDALNKDKLPAYATADLGARYLANVSGHDITTRLNITNVTDKNYWLSSQYLGTPRGIRLSVQVAL